MQYLRVRRQSGPPAWATGDVVTPVFGAGWGLGCAFVDNDDTIYTYASNEAHEVGMFTATDLSPTSPWTSAIALTLSSAYTIFNTAVAKGVLDGSPTYAMAIEVNHGGLGGGFNLVFATAPTAAGPWKLQQSLPASRGLMFGPGSCPALRYDAETGYWHMMYTPNPTVAGGDYRTWQIYATRSKTLADGSWEASPLNPVMVADAFDRQIHNADLPESQRGWAANTSNLNDSDPDLVEFEGQVCRPRSLLSRFALTFLSPLSHNRHALFCRIRCRSSLRSVYYSTHAILRSVSLRIHIRHLLLNQNDERARRLLTKQPHSASTLLLR